MRSAIPAPCARLLLGLALYAAGMSSASASATLPVATARALDDVLACERPTGGWTYACDPATGPHGAATKIVVRAGQIAAPFGFDDWDLLVLRSPGTPAAGLVLLDGYRASGDERYLAAACRAGAMLIATQLSSGGWASEMPVHGDRLARWFRLLNRWTALDDDVTPGAARFLAELWAVTGDAAQRAAAERAFDLLLAAQLADGGWPLTWREPRILTTIAPSFEDLPSTNDGATSAPIEALLVGARVLGRPDLLDAARRGGDWLLRVQGPPRQAAWAQQYHVDGSPAPGRRFEPAGYAAWESREMLSALLALARETGDARYAAAAPGAVDWFMRSAITPGCWARLYEPGSNAPLFTARDGRRVANAAEAKRPYKWTGDFGIPGLLATLGLNEDGTPRDSHAPLPPQRIPGDAGTCVAPAATAAERAGEENGHETPNPRRRIAHAAILLAALDRDGVPGAFAIRR